MSKRSGAELRKAAGADVNFTRCRITDILLERDMLEAKTYTGIDNLPEQYSRLFEDASQDSIFLSLPWFRNLEKTVLGVKEVARIIGVERRDLSCAPLGALVLKVNRRANRLLSQLTIDSLTNYYTSYFAPVLARQGADLQVVSTALVRELCSPGYHWDVLNIRPVDLSSPAVQGLHGALADWGLKTQTYFCFGNWYLNVDGRSYREYFKDLPSVIRKNVPYYRRRLEKAARVKTEIYTNSNELDAAIRDYEITYNSSWRDFEGYPKFISGLIRTAAEQGWLRMGILYVDDEPAAAQLWIVHAGIASIYKICYAEKFAKSSVGSVLTAHMLEHVLDVDKVREVDYLTGDDAYKANWMSDRRERWGIMAFNPKTIRGNLGIVRHIGGQRLKSTWSCFSNNVGSFGWLHSK